MRIVVILQIFSIILVSMVLIKSILEMKKSASLYEGLSYDREKRLVLRVTYVGGNESIPKRRRNIIAKDQLNLTKGTCYYLGTGSKFFTPNYIRVRRGYFPKQTQLLISVRDEGIEVAVLKGEIETSYQLEAYKANKQAWIYISRKDYFECNGYRFFVE